MLYNLNPKQTYKKEDQLQYSKLQCNQIEFGAELLKTERDREEDKSREKEGAFL